MPIAHLTWYCKRSSSPLFNTYWMYVQICTHFCSQSSIRIHMSRLIRLTEGTTITTDRGCVGWSTSSSTPFRTSRSFTQRCHLLRWFFVASDIILVFLTVALYYLLLRHFILKRCTLGFAHSYMGSVPPPFPTHYDKITTLFVIVTWALYFLLLQFFITG